MSKYGHFFFKGKPEFISIDEPMQDWTIVKNLERYGGSHGDFANCYPNEIKCHGTKEQAIELADTLSNTQAGCDYAFYVKELEDEY